MRKIGFIGNGKLTQQIQNFIACSSTVFDDFTGEYGFNEYKNYLPQYEWILGIGYYHMKLRVDITKFILNHQGKFFTTTHPSSYICSTSTIKEGTVIYPMCNIDKGVTLHPNTLLNNSVVVCHDSSIGTGCYISPGVTICGEVTIDEGCFVGAGSIISNGVHIGKNSIIGVGTVVTKNVPPNSSVIGNPMKILNQNLELK